MLAVVGTRPEAIKMAPVVRALRHERRIARTSGSEDQVEPHVVFTGQHTTLVDPVLTALTLSGPGVHGDTSEEAVRHHELGIMREDQSLYDVVHRTLGGADSGRDGLREVVQRERPDLILVQGDTATVFVASLVGFFEKVPVGHVEAGLRSGDKWVPYPEEIFRRLTDVIADHHFAPTRRARDLLLEEHAPTRRARNVLSDGNIRQRRAPELPREEDLSAPRIHLTGNTVVDALLSVAEQDRPIGDDDLRAVVEGDRRLVLLTAHRRESFGEPIREVFRAVRRLADEVADVEIVYPVHPNPNVREPADELLSGHPRIRLIEPLDYFDVVAALKHAALILTDSGGIQEEAPTFGTPVLVLREVTERPEGIEAGVAELVGTDGELIVERARAVLESREEREAVPNPYGDGRAGERIADIVVSELTGRERRTTDWDG